MTKYEPKVIKSEPKIDQKCLKIDQKWTKYGFKYVKWTKIHTKIVQKWKWSKTLKNYLSCKMCNAIDCEIVHFTTALIVLNAIKEREKWTIIIGNNEIKVLHLSPICELSRTKLIAQFSSLKSVKMKKSRTWARLSFHYFLSNNEIRDLREIAIGQIFIGHVNWTYAKIQTQSIFNQIVFGLKKIVFFCLRVMYQFLADSFLGYFGLIMPSFHIGPGRVKNFQKKEQF